MYIYIYIYIYIYTYYSQSVSLVNKMFNLLKLNNLGFHFVVLDYFLICFAWEILVFVIYMVLNLSLWPYYTGSILSLNLN